MELGVLSEWEMPLLRRPRWVCRLFLACKSNACFKASAGLLMVLSYYLLLIKLGPLEFKCPLRIF